MEKIEKIYSEGIKVRIENELNEGIEKDEERIEEIEEGEEKV